VEGCWPVLAPIIPSVTRVSTIAAIPVSTPGKLVQNAANADLFCRLYYPAVRHGRLRLSHSTVVVIGDVVIRFLGGSTESAPNRVTQCLLPNSADDLGLIRANVDVLRSRIVITSTAVEVHGRVSLGNQTKISRSRRTVPWPGRSSTYR
jgi:hypothetical protein